ncbi:MAG: polysaccharide deacetylase family protein [Acutalibacteraceae bacterium]|nr:polysaccharide deacetylase family protein [Acutalibacteraceae bacterium]
MVLCMAVIIGTGLSRQEAIPTAAESDNWGLNFKTADGIPTGNTSAAELKKYGAFYLGDTSQKKIYLTFDAGYENGYTADILQTLKKHNVRAAFFLVGNYIQTSPDLVKQMVADGHIVGNHTMTHPDMGAIAEESAFREELEGLEKLYQEVTGEQLPKFYRPPQGKFSVENLKMAQKMGYKTVFWSLAYADWLNDQQPTREEAFDKLIPRIHNGAVVLLHSTSQTNAAILDELLTKWEDMGYTFAPLTELS